MNIWHVLLSFQCIHESYMNGARSIGYVTPYRAQSQMMEALLQDLYEEELKSADIIAATVHRFQGSERDIMIFDTVDSEPQERAGMLLTGRDSERLLNVAITRTKGKFIHISNTAYIQKHVYHGKTLRNLVEHQARNQQCITTKEIGTWIQHQLPKLNWMHARKIDRLVTDMTNARSSIVIALPKDTVIPPKMLTIIEKRKKNVNLTVISQKNWSELLPDCWQEETAPYPFIIIDHFLIWLGVPFEGIKGIEPPYIAVRLESEKVAEILFNNNER